MGLYRFCPIPACIADLDEPLGFVPEPAPEGSSQCSVNALQYEGCRACEYYRCREERAQCGAEGYLIDFGYRYCLKYRLVSEPEASAAAQVTFKEIRRCLIESLDREVPGDDCEELQEKGIASHLDCYIESGFCDLPLSDWFVILNTIDPSDFDLLQMLSAGKYCVDQWLGDD